MESWVATAGGMTRSVDDGAVQALEPSANAVTGSQQSSSKDIVGVPRANLGLNKVV